MTSFIKIYDQNNSISKKDLTSEKEKKEESKNISNFEEDNKKMPSSETIDEKDLTLNKEKEDNKNISNFENSKKNLLLTINTRKLSSLISINYIFIF